MPPVTARAVAPSKLAARGPQALGIARGHGAAGPRELFSKGLEGRSPSRQGNMDKDDILRLTALASCAG